MADSTSMRVFIVVPTLNPGGQWKTWVRSVIEQSCQPEKVIVVDSGSDDRTLDLAPNSNFSINRISVTEFNHGGTRQKAIKHLLDSDMVVFLTQDAILASTDALECILRPFVDESVTAVCGRQLPRKNAESIEAHARIFNYASQSYVRSIADVKACGLKTAFISNSFAAYRVSALKEVGGFPDNVIFGEDMYVAAKMLKAGYKIAYMADACVYHSHDYTLWQEFKRYFDMGVFHAREPWIREEFGGAEGEGLRFVVSELKYLLKHAFWRIPEALLRNFFSYAGFRLGLIEKYLPLWLKRQLAMNKNFFN